MNQFQYINAQSVETARKATEDGDGRYLAGGIDLLGELKDYIDSPERVDRKSVV
mgnify:CR=1 FL=1